MNDKSSFLTSNKENYKNLTNKETYNPEDYEFTQSVLLNKKLRELDPINEKLLILQNQSLKMDTSLEDMRKNREEARKQLEARFNDVYRNINNTKEFVILEGKRINGTLLAFESKFDTKLNLLDNKYQDIFDNFKVETNNNFENVKVKCDDLYNLIEKEKQERIKQSKDNLNEINEKIDKLENNLDKEINNRVNDTNKLDRKIDDCDFEINEKINKEKNDRISKINDIKVHLTREIDCIRKETKTSQEKINEEFNHLTTNLQKEMQHRLSEQDSIIDNLFNTIQTIEKTFKILGKDA